ncbi:MAG: hypothetical protein PHU80_09860, partial [Kiritimatiellae bacterium]|nr:hypothetical protein [Kiritimatiellia bacterium]
MKACKSVIWATVAVLVGASAFGQTTVRSGAAVLDTRAKGYEIAVCAYSFRKYTAFEAIEKTKAAGGEVIEFFLWQKLAPEYPD